LEQVHFPYTAAGTNADVDTRQLSEKLLNGGYGSARWFRQRHQSPDSGKIR
jgi:hypothetical protein